MTRRTTSASFSHPSTNPIAPYGPPVRGRTPHPGEARGEVVHELLEQPFARPRAPPIRRHPHAVAAEPSSTPHPRVCSLPSHESGTRRPSALRTQGFARYPSVSPERFLSGIRRVSACTNRKSCPSRFTCKTAVFGEPTSGLEPLTPAPATSDQSGVAEACTDLQNPHSWRVFLALPCPVLHRIALPVVSEWYQQRV
jgi:hypothetical protein